MTGPQLREPREPPQGGIGPALVLLVMSGGAALSWIFALLAAARF